MSDQTPYGSQGQQPGHQPYPQAAAAYGAPQSYAKPPIPPPAALAVKLMWAGAALALLGVIFAFTMQDQMRAQLVDAGIPAAQVDAAITFGMVIGVVVGLVGVGLWVLNAVFNAKGQNWARILSTVLAGLNIAFTLIGLTQPAPLLSRITSLIGLVLAAVIVVLLWRPANQAFYASGPR